MTGISQVCTTIKMGRLEAKIGIVLWFQKHLDQPNGPETTCKISIGIKTVAYLVDLIVVFNTGVALFLAASSFLSLLNFALTLGALPRSSGSTLLKFPA